MSTLLRTPQLSEIHRQPTRSRRFHTIHVRSRIRALRRAAVRKSGHRQGHFHPGSHFHIRGNRDVVSIPLRRSATSQKQVYRKSGSRMTEICEEKKVPLGPKVS